MGNKSGDAVAAIMKKAAYEAMVRALTEDEAARKEVLEAGVAESIDQALNTINLDHYALKSMADQAMREVALGVARTYMADDERAERIRKIVSDTIEKILVEELPRIVMQALERGMGQRL